MAEFRYPPSSRELSEKRRALAPDTEKAFQAFSQQVFADGALPAKTKQLIAVAVTRHAMPLLHPRTHESRTPPRCDAPGADGGHLGCGRDAGGRRLCPHRDLADRNG